MFDFLEGLLHLLQPRPIGQVVIDILDLAIVTYVIYRALLVLRGTRAMQMGIGLGVIAIIYVAAGRVGFVTLYNLLSTLLSSIILIVVVVFQNDIRRGLMRVGARAFFGGITREQESRVIDEVVVVGQGTVIDAAVQRELLVGIFVPESVNKLHDGAVVIRNLRIAKAGVFFPMPDTKVLDKSLGSRHRAALGITEETDAVVVVVSEERGTIGFCFNGNIVSNLDGASLRQALLGLFGQKTRTPKKRPTGKRVATPVPQRLTPSASPPPASSATPAARDGNTGSVILPKAARDSVMPVAPTVAARVVPVVASRQESPSSEPPTSARERPIPASEPPSSRDPKQGS